MGFVTTPADMLYSYGCFEPSNQFSGFYDIISQSSWVNIPKLIGYSSISIVAGAIRVIFWQRLDRTTVWGWCPNSPFMGHLPTATVVVTFPRPGLSKTRVPVLPLVIVSPVNPPFSIISYFVGEIPLYPHVIIHPHLIIIYNTWW